MTGPSVLVWLRPGAGLGNVTQQMVTVSLSNGSKQISACETESMFSRAVQDLTWSKAPLPVYIHFILWPRKSNSVALAAVGKSTTL